jgi:hypothetical protein
MKKIYVVVNGVGFYTSARSISKGVGRSDVINNVVQRSYSQLLRANVNDGAVGVGYSDMDGYQIQIEFV